MVGGKGRASPLWVVAPYDRVHGWYSSWGRSLPAADAAPSASASASASESSSGAAEAEVEAGAGAEVLALGPPEVAGSVGRAYGSGSISGPEKAVVQRIQGTSIEEYIRS